MRPLQPKKNVAPNENRISTGRIVEYLQHGVSRLGVVLASKKDKWALLNQDGGELEVPADRLELLPEAIPESLSTKDQKAAFLKQLVAEAGARASEASLEEAWELIQPERDECSVVDLTELLFGAVTLESAVAMKLLLAQDQVFFKRKKTGSLEPRTPEVVAELKQQVAAEQRRLARVQQSADRIIARLKDPSAELPTEIEQFEGVAALGKTAPSAKEVLQIVDAVVERSGISLPQGPAERVFELLCKLQHFTVHENLTPIRMGRPTAFSAEELAEVDLLKHSGFATQSSARQDCTGLLTVTIDGAETKDFDDAVSLERIPTGYRIGVHIADVASAIVVGSKLEAAAFRRASSVYCPDQTLPMLPAALCEDVLSLREGTTRPVLSCFIETDEAFQIVNRRLQRSLIRIGKRLSYEDADTMLCEDNILSSELHPLLQTLWEVALASEHRRLELGATQFSRREMSPVVDDQGRVSLTMYDEETPSRKLISELMVLANETAALYARDQRIALIFRSQEPPDVELSSVGLDIDPGPAREYFQRSMFKRSVTGTSPASHYGLGLEAYAQATSPLRRSVDLLNQRQLATYLETGQAYYSPEQLSQAHHLLEIGLDETNLINRERNRYWMLQYLVQEGLKELTGTVMKLEGPRPLVEVDQFYSFFVFQIRDAAARSRLRLGQKIKLKVEAVSPRKDSITLLLVE